MSFSKWNQFKFSDFVSINPTISLKGGNTYSFIEMKDLSEGKRFVQPSANKKLTGGARFREGNTLFARITPCLENGKIGQAKNLNDGVGFGSTEFLIFEEKQNVSNKDFIYYLACWQEVRKFAEQNMVGTSGRQRVGKDAFEKLELKLPDLISQVRIASILSSLDDKIELNNKTNQTLEAIVETLFKEMCLPKVDLLEDGWRMGTISEIGKVITGKTPSSNNPEDFGNYKPFVTPTDFKNYGKIILSAVRHLSKEGVNKLKNKIIPKNSVLVTCIGSDMGKVAINRVECLTNQQINSIITKNSFVDFIYYSLLFKYDLLRNMATGGSTMPMINKSQFEEIKLMIPSNIVLEKFQSVIAPINNQIENNIKETQTLTTLRDGLLPKLMKGEIIV